jgi:hypothetical protein
VRTTRGSGYWSYSPVPRPEFSHRPIKSSLHRRAAGHRPLGQHVPQTRSSRVPNPPISHASETLPRSDGPGSDPSVKTTSKRPHLKRGLPGCGGSPSVWLQTELAIRLSSPHPSATLATASDVLCKASQAPVGETHLRARPQYPFPGGYILQGRRIDRSDPGRPAVPKRHFSRGSGAPSFQAESTPVSRRSQHPVENPTKSTLRHSHPQGRRPTRQPQQQPPGNAHAPGVEGQPVSHSRGVKGQPVSPSLAQPQSPPSQTP